MFLNSEDLNTMNFSESKTQENIKSKVIPLEQRKLNQLTIKQIQTAKPPQENENLYIDGVEVSQIYLCAQIISINKKLGYTEFQVNDYSGTLIIKKWNNDDNEQKVNEFECFLNKWVKIYGKVHPYKGYCSINAFEILPITNFDELTYYGLEVIYQHLHNTVKQGIKKKDTTEPPSKEHIISENELMSDLTSVHKQILTIISDNDHSETGCSLSILYQEASNESRETINKACEYLSNEGYIYSTVDEDHYKSSY